jgi:tetratricopeptide (TPR) repeat protein
MKTKGSNIPKREKLSRFVDLARVYRGWTRSELSKALGRDPTKLVPESGNPKLDLLVGIADALDWHIGDVAESVWNERPKHTPDGTNFTELRGLANTSFHEGNYEELVRISKRMRGVARNSEERARASYVESLAWDGVGRYARSLECIQEALTERELPPSLQIVMESSLANAHYAQWHLIEARAVADDLIERLESRNLDTTIDRASLAYAHYVSGSTSRRMIEANCPDLPRRTRDARMHLRRAIELYTDVDAESGGTDPSYLGIANTCTGGLIEVDAADGSISPLEAVELISHGLEAAVDPEHMPAGSWLESWGWWSIYGCNIALRGLDGPALHHNMAIFTNKAIEIADRLGNWSMRERAFTMENFRRRRVTDSTGFQPDWALDEEDIRVITGTMGRFPGFRDTGWNILETARVFESH